MKFRTPKGDAMKKYYLRILLVLVGFAGLSGIARAQEHVQIIVNLPFEFVVSGKTLPAGTYTVTRLLSENGLQGLILSSRENRVSVLAHPVEIEIGNADKSSVSFERVGESNFLSKVATTDAIYTISVPRAATTQAAMKANDAMRSSASGSN
jgi:hypothetical protein